MGPCGPSDRPRRLWPEDDQSAGPPGSTGSPGPREADVLVAAKIDRVSRSTSDFARLLDHAEKKGWKVVVLDVEVDTTTAAGRLVVEVVSAAASFESRRIGERQRAVHAVRRSQGKRAGQAPLLPGAVRSRIAADRADGISLNAIAAALNDEAVPTAKGGVGTHRRLGMCFSPLRLMRIGEGTIRNTHVVGFTRWWSAC